MRLGTARLVIGRESSREALIAELHQHGPVLLAAARIITLDRAEAEDLVQTTFEIALRRIDTLRDPGALRAWLLRIETRGPSGRCAVSVASCDIASDGACQLAAQPPAKPAPAGPPTPTGESTVP